MPLSKQIIKIGSLIFFAVISMIKLLCVLVLSRQKDSPCVAGWHINEELSNHLLLLNVGLIPDIIMLLCIAIGMAFETSNIGADPWTIIYNCIVGLLTFCSFLPFIGIEDCTSDSLATIKIVGICAAIAGALQIINGVVCILFLAPEERSDPKAQPTTSNPKPTENSEPKPSTSKAANEKVS